MKKRRKIGDFLIEQNDDKNVGLDFFCKMEFNNDTRVATGSQRLEHELHKMWMTDTGDLQEQSRRNKPRSLPARGEDFRQKDCALTQLWKAKAPKEQLLKRRNLSG